MCSFLDQSQYEFDHSTLRQMPIPMTRVMGSHISVKYEMGRRTWSKGRGIERSVVG